MEAKYMPRQNRVTPFGEIVAHPARGTLMGNRGCLHDDQGRLTQKRWAHQAWVACRLEFNGWKRNLMAPNLYTELFFTDEAVALAAGHRPCGTCRHADYRRFQDTFGKAFPDLGVRPSPSQVDKLLHRSRVDSRSKAQITFEAEVRDLPPGVFYKMSGDPRPLLRRNNGCSAWTSDGYEEVDCDPHQGVTVLTPQPIVEAIRAGYAVLM